MKPLNSRRHFLKGSTLGIAAAPFLWSQMGTRLEAGIDSESPYSRSSDLKITRVRSAYMRGHGTHLFIKIETNQGITGFGEGMDAVSGTVGLVQRMADRLKGKNPLDVNRLVEDVLRSGFFHGAQSGMYVAVLTAIVFALWDLAGKALGLPVYRMLGGKFRDKIRIYCDTASSRESPERMGELAREVQDHGEETGSYLHY
jgi:galactonate dehydratase